MQQVEEWNIRSLAIRGGGDYVRTTFANSTAAMRFQNNLRIVTSIVYGFGKRWK
jgi:hypothetical protein